jgi:hypothetical protein
MALTRHFAARTTSQHLTSYAYVFIWDCSVVADNSKNAIIDAEGLLIHIMQTHVLAPLDGTCLGATDLVPLPTSQSQLPHENQLVKAWQTTTRNISS